MKKNSPPSPQDLTIQTYTNATVEHQTTRPLSAELGQHIENKTAQIDWSSLVEIAQGAQGVVYKAVLLYLQPGQPSTTIQRIPVALKKLLPTKDTGKHITDSFPTYAALTESLISTAQYHITHLIARVTFRHERYAVMPLLDKSILKLLPFFHSLKNINLSAYSFLVMSMVLDILVALEYMHDHNLGHRDIKPENILWYPEIGHFVVTDMDSLHMMECAGEAFHGTLGFTHPAVFSEDEAHPIPSDDIYSLGKVLKCLLDPDALHNLRKPIESVGQMAYILSEREAYQLAQKNFVQEDKRALSPLINKNIPIAAEQDHFEDIIVNHLNKIADRMIDLDPHKIPSIEELKIQLTQLKEKLRNEKPALAAQINPILINMSCNDPELYFSPKDTQSQSQSSTTSSLFPLSPIYPTPASAQTVQYVRAPSLFIDSKSKDQDNTEEKKRTEQSMGTNQFI